MKKMTLALGCLLLIANVAFGQVRFEGDLTERNIMVFDDFSTVDFTPDPAELDGTWYSNMAPGPNGFSAFAAAGGVVATDDYQAAVPAGDEVIQLSEFKFVGGVDTVGGVAFFDFFDADEAFVDGFGVALPQAGDFIWTITIGSDVQVPADGFVQMVVDDTGMFGPPTLGRMFLGDAGPTIGTTANDPPGVPVVGEPGQFFNHNFEITGNSLVPEPGSLALFAMGGLLLGLSRRRG